MEYLYIFDLDDTLWSPEVTSTFLPPFVLNGNCISNNTTTIMINKKCLDLINEIYLRKGNIAFASRNSNRNIIKNLLSLLKFPNTNVSLLDYSSATFIYPSHKNIHMFDIHQKTNISYSKMILFDDKLKNCEIVTYLQVQCIHNKFPRLDEITIQQNY